MADQKPTNDSISKSVPHPSASLKDGALTGGPRVAQFRDCHPVEDEQLAGGTNCGEPPIPCCKNMTLSELPPETFAICPVCNREDDDVHFHDEGFEGGANNAAAVRPPLSEPASSRFLQPTTRRGAFSGCSMQ